MQFITAVYFTHDKKRRCIFISNPGISCTQASEYSKSIEASTAPEGATSILSRTYQLGKSNHIFN